VEGSEEKKPPGRPMCRWDNIKTDLKKRQNGRLWTGFAYQALVNFQIKEVPQSFQTVYHSIESSQCHHIDVIHGKELINVIHSFQWYS
jgi:hypothetical protein